MKNLTKVLSVSALLGVVNVALAGSVSLAPNAQVGNTISFDVNVDFTTGGATIDGTFQLGFNTSVLSDVDGDAKFEYNTTFLTGNNLSSYTVAPGSGVFTNVGFSTIGLGETFMGSGTLGTLSFLVFNTGPASVTSGPDVFPRENGFLNSTGTSYLDMSYGSASPQVSAVPVPAAVWLMASGLLGMVALSRRS